jgi:hypothetical protein
MHLLYKDSDGSAYGQEVFNEVQNWTALKIFRCGESAG